jgi:hypothetical protein
MTLTTLLHSQEGQQHSRQSEEMLKVSGALLIFVASVGDARRAALTTHVGEALSTSLWRLPFEDVFRGQPRKPQDDARVAENGLRPQGVGGLLKGREIFGTHLHVDLDSSFSAGFHSPYRYVGTLSQQRYCWYLSYHYI